MQFIYFLFFKLWVFICLFMAVLGLRFCARSFSSCGKRGPLFIAVRGPLTIAASLVAEHRLQTRRLSNCAHGPCCSAACGIFPDQDSNLCPLNWQADSQSLRHQGRPIYFHIPRLFLNPSVVVVGTDSIKWRDGHHLSSHITGFIQNPTHSRILIVSFI